MASGGTASSLAAQLQRTGLIDHPRLLSWILRLKETPSGCGPESTPLRPATTLAELMARIVQGAVVSHAFRILEGSRIAEVLAALQAEPRLRRTLDKDHPQTLLADLGLDVGTGPHGEGWFFPDTYTSAGAMSDRALLLRTHARMLAELDSVWARRAARLPYQTPYEVLIAASLIEKETSRAEDRAHVSQVLAARLRRNMRLQVDPAVIYGLGDAYDRDLTRADLRRPTPYNTYVHKGLPPTPIALPGRARCRPRCIRAGPRTCTSSPEATAPATSRRPWRNTMRRCAVSVGAALAGVKGFEVGRQVHHLGGHRRRRQVNADARHSALAGRCRRPLHPHPGAGRHALGGGSSGLLLAQRDEPVAP